MNGHHQQQDENPFGASSSNTASSSPFGASGNDSPFGASGNDSPFGSSTDNNPFGAAPAAQEDPFAIGNGFASDAAHVVPDPFGAAPVAAAAAAQDPFAIGNDAGHVVPNPFAAAADPFAIGNAGHVVPNPFGAAPAPPAEDPFAFGNNNNGGGGGGGHVVANPFAFGGFGAAAAAAAAAVVNPFGIANDGPADNRDELDVSQHSVGETFLQGHMTRLAEETSMRLTQDETRWARELKAAVEASSKDTNMISDMEIAQQAIAHQGNVLNALLSIKALQEFRTAYHIEDTPEQGLQAIQALLDQQEGTFLDIDTNPQTQESVLVVDLRAFQPAKSLQIIQGKSAHHSWHVLARGIYYLYKATQPSLAAVRHGLFLVVDCDGVSWENFSSEVDQRLHAELLQHVPLCWKKIMAYSTALVANVWWGLTKRLFSTQFCSKLEKGCRLVDTDPSRPPRRLSEMYRQPDLATVQQKFERRARELYDIRETNEQAFQIRTRSAAATHR